MPASAFQKATATYHRALSKAIEQAQEAADRASAAAAHYALTDTAPVSEGNDFRNVLDATSPILIAGDTDTHEMATGDATGEALSANAGHLGDIPYAALLPLADGPADPVEAEVGQG